MSRERNFFIPVETVAWRTGAAGLRVCSIACAGGCAACAVAPVAEDSGGVHHRSCQRCGVCTSSRRRRPACQRCLRCAARDRRWRTTWTSRCTPQTQLRRSYTGSCKFLPTRIGSGGLNGRRDPISHCGIETCLLNFTKFCSGGAIRNSLTRQNAPRHTARGHVTMVSLRHNSSR